MSYRDILTDLRLALALLTRLPLPHLPDGAFAHQARAVWAYPLAGAVTGAIACACAALALWLGLSPALAAGLAIAAQIITTGAMHEDGLADMVDGVWGGWTRDRRLEIMKDSQIGTYGVLALILSLGLRWQALILLLPLSPLVLIATGAFSRAGLPALMAALPHARDSGLSHSVGRPAIWPVWVALALGLGVALIALGPFVLLPVVLGSGAAGLVGTVARAKLGGQTGDVLGATQQMVELILLLTLVALL